MSADIKQVSFSGGEISPSLYARTDNAIYEKALRTLLNMLVMRQGGVTGRPGTQYVGLTLNGGSAVRLIPFVFNETAAGQSYVLEFGDLYVAFYQDGGILQSGGANYTIVSQYAQADLATLNFSQSGDIITIVHPNYPPTELRRSGSTSWAFAPVTYDGTGTQITVLFSGGAAGTNTYYQVTTVMANGDEGIPTAFELDALKIPTTAAPITLSWTAYPGAVSYRIYKYDVGTPPVGAVTGFIGVTTGVSFLDNGITADYSNNPPISGPLKASVAAGDYPSVVGQVQQRRVFAATPLNPIGVWESAPGSPGNFSVHATVLDSDSIFFSIAGDEVNTIRAALEIKFMLLMTDGAELYVQGNGSGVVTPTAINASVQSQYGCNPLRPLKIGDILLFNQSLGSAIRDFAFDFAIDGYRGNDITIFSSHMFEGYTIEDWAYQKLPDSLIWAVRSDGTLLCCTYVREQQVLAWSRHQLTDGTVENICAIPENGEYAVYLSVLRTLNGANSGTTVTIITGVNDSIDIAVYNGTVLFGNFSAIIPAGVYTGAGLATAVATALNTLNITSNEPDPILWFCQYLNGVLSIWQSTDFPHSGGQWKLLGASGANVARSVIPYLGWPASDTSLNSLSNPLSGVGQELTAPLFLFTSDQRTLERMSSRIWSDPLEATYLDIFVSFDGRNTGSTTMTLTASGGFSTDDTAYQQQLTLTSSVDFFEDTMIGNQIFLQDALFISSNGSEGNNLRCTIQAYTSHKIVTVTPSGLVPAEFQAIAITTWARAVQSVSGLGYLYQKEVSVWADRFVVGSPLNSSISTVYTVPASGALTFDKPYSVIYVGVPMTQDVETLNLSTAAGESVIASRRRSATLAFFMQNTRTLFAGTENPDTNSNNDDGDALFELFEMVKGASQKTYDEPPVLGTGEDYIIMDTRWNKNGRIFIRNVDPVPLTILAISPQGDSKGDNPFMKRV